MMITGAHLPSYSRKREYDTNKQSRYILNLLNENKIRYNIATIAYHTVIPDLGWGLTPHPFETMIRLTGNYCAQPLLVKAALCKEGCGRNQPINVNYLNNPRKYPPLLYEYLTKKGECMCFSCLYDYHEHLNCCLVINYCATLKDSGYKLPHYSVRQPIINELVVKYKSYLPHNKYKIRNCCCDVYCCNELIVNEPVNNALCTAYWQTGNSMEYYTIDLLDLVAIDAQCEQFSKINKGHIIEELYVKKTMHPQNLQPLLDNIDLDVDTFMCQLCDRA